MSEIPKKKNYSESAFNAIGGFFGSLFDIYTGIFDLLEGPWTSLKRPSTTSLYGLRS